ncbi:rRNA (guanine-N1)-methyltransferase, partial [Salmonella enterica subsp. enterica serovar Give]|nr:rRNA (guanine-N1)-methyltransferase [Salmonella enterica subsp. enterica serovar Give]
MNKIIRFNDSEKLFRCPICKRKLKMVGNSLLCSNKHCFDISKLGYVNFALNQKQSKHYSRTSFESRMDILEKGYYSHILTEITHIL